MPCWYFEKKDLQNTPSFRDGIGPETEGIYRRDGARFIIDAGTKMGLRYDTCATGVVYFHRFYLFHSFKEFDRYVTAACCLFLAGKVEETPKKCKDLIKITRSMLNDEQFASFGQDPREEVMTLERILLQTIKFDLMVEHPYAFVLKFAKLIKGDKNKVQKMVQMAWTFVNDSLCTTLCLQWEPEVIAVALMYLTSRLNKFDIVDWQGKPASYRGKWFEFFVDDVTLDLLEDICHQVLDLYSKPAPKSTESPAPAVPVQSQHSSTEDQSRTPRTPKSPMVAKRVPPGSSAVDPSATTSLHSMDTTTQQSLRHESPSVRSTAIPLSQGSAQRLATTSIAAPPVAPVLPPPSSKQLASCEGGGSGASSSSYSQANPYIAQQMYNSSFMSQEGSASIQSLMGVPQAISREESHTKTKAQTVGGRQPPVQQSYQQPPVAGAQYTVPTYQQQPATSSYPFQPNPAAPGGGNYHTSTVLQPLPPVVQPAVAYQQQQLPPQQQQFAFNANQQYQPLQQQLPPVATYNPVFPAQPSSNQQQFNVQSGAGQPYTGSSVSGQNYTQPAGTGGQQYAQVPASAQTNFTVHGGSLQQQYSNTLAPSSTQQYSLPQQPVSTQPYPMQTGAVHQYPVQPGSSSHQYPTHAGSAPHFGSSAAPHNYNQYSDDNQLQLGMRSHDSNQQRHGQQSLQGKGVWQSGRQDWQR